MGEERVTHLSCPEDALVNFDWCSGNAIELCSLGADSTASKCDWASPGFSARRVAYSLAPLFRQLSQEKLAGNITPKVLSKYADDVSKAVMDDNFDFSNLSDAAAMQLFHEKAVWEMLALFYVHETNPSISIAQALSDWLRKFDFLYAEISSPPALTEFERLKASDRPDADKAYWPLLQKAAAVGWLQDAYDLLTNHSVFTTSFAEQQRSPNLKAQYQIVDCLARLLAKMPIWTASSPGEEEAVGLRFDNRADYVAEREQWLGEVTEKLLQDADAWQKIDSYSKTTAEGLQQVVATLCGYPEAASATTSTWLELLICQLHHSYPGLTVQSGLPTLLERCLQEKPPSSDHRRLTMLQQLMEAVCDDAVQNVVQICSQSLSSWFMAHIHDLLLAKPSSKPVLEAILPHLGCTQIETFISEYGTTLATGASTWQLAVNYFAQCPRYGQASVEAMIESHLQSDDPKAIQTLLGICDKYGLKAMKAAVFQAQGQKCLQDGMVGEGFSWLLKMDNLAPAEKAACNLILDAAEKHGEFNNLESWSKLQDLEPLLANVLEGSSQSRSPLAFLRSYLQLTRGMKDVRDSAEGAQALLAMVQYDFAMLTPSPTQQSSLLLDLLVQSIPLMEHIPPKFTVPEAGLIRQANLGLRISSANAKNQLFLCRAQACSLAVERLCVRAHLHQTD